MVKRNTRNKAILLFVTAIITTGCTVRRISEMEEEATGDDQFSTWTKSGTQFDPVVYVDSIWSDRVLPTFEEGAVDMVTLLEQIEQDRNAAIERYGRSISSGATVGAFITRGTGTVVSHDDTSRNGRLRISLFPVENKREVTIQIGPVIRKTAIRDSLEFIRFTDIGNQLQFAALGDELNARARAEAVEPLPLDMIEGQEIKFLGAFTMETDETGDDIVVTPVKISLSKATE